MKSRRPAAFLAPGRSNVKMAVGVRKSRGHMLSLRTSVRSRPRAKCKIGSPGTQTRISASGRVRPPHSQGREASRHAGAGADEVSARHQSQDRQGVGPRHAGASPADRRRGDRVRRREFITLLGCTAVVWPFGARAQQPTTPVIGFVSAGSTKGYAQALSAFLKGLDETGYVDGHNVVVEYRWAEGRNDLLPSLVTDLVQRKVNVIAATTTPAALAAKAATATIPIVFTTIADPVQIGLVKSLNRPGGNMTGVTLLSVEVGPKLLELLHDMVPKATIMALLVNPTNPNVETQSKNLQVAALKLGLQPHVMNASTERDFDEAFAKLHELRADALMISQDPFFNIESGQLGALSVRHAIPAIYVNREFAATGGLMSYGANQADEWRQAGIYVGRILKGEKPADLPVVQPTKFDLVINLKTAKSLGLEIN